MLLKSEIKRQDLQAELTRTQDQLKHVQLQLFAAQDQVATLTLQLAALASPKSHKTRQQLFKKRLAPKIVGVKKEALTPSRFSQGLGIQHGLDDFYSPDKRGHEIELRDYEAISEVKVITTKFT